MSIFTIIKNIIGWIIFLVSLPFLLIGIVGWSLLLISEYFGVLSDEDNDIYLSGPFKGFPKD